LQKPFVGAGHAREQKTIAGMARSYIQSLLTSATCQRQNLNHAEQTE